MGSSYTIHVIGIGASNRVCYAMNKVEMAQQKKIMADEGTPVVEWYAQTKKGAQMIR